MKRPSLAAMLILLLAAALPAWAADDPPRVRVKATGQAPASLTNAREAAVEDALRRCVEAAGGVHLSAVSESEDFGLVSDVIYTKTAGFIERYEVLEENPDQAGLFTVRVSAIVSRGQLMDSVDAFKSLLRRKGRPRVLVVGSADGQPLDQLLTAKLQGQLERKGVRVIDTARLDVNQRQNAERAARSDRDLKKAALIADQTGADILAIVSVEGEFAGAEETYGVKRHVADAVGIVRLVRADTAQVMGSEVVEKRVNSDTHGRLERKAAGQVVEQAMEQAIKRIASHWLEEVDGRGGQEIQIVIHRFDFARMTGLVQNLRKVEGVKEVIVDRTDAESTGQLRVVTNATASDVAMALIKLDPKLEVISSTANRVEVR